MFFDFYGLDEQPFGVTPDPRFLYMGSAQQEALASLRYGIQTGRGFIALIAAPGLGKTTMLLHLLEGFGSSTRSVFLVQMHANANEFLRSLLADLDAVPVSNNLLDLQTQLRDVLIKEAQAGTKFVVVIDEAQNLDDEILEAVRMLSNFETSSSKLMQIVLSGQPQLADKLAAPQLEQLRQRISIIARFPPLDEDDVPKYIHHRLHVAGYIGPALFTPEAMDLIVSHCKGIPRNINNLCFHALSLGCVANQKQIDDTTVQQVIADLNLAILGTEIAARVPLLAGAPPKPPVASEAVLAEPVKEPSDFDFDVAEGTAAGGPLTAAPPSKSSAVSETIFAEPAQESADLDFDVAEGAAAGAALTAADLLGSEESPHLDAAAAKAERAEIEEDFAKAAPTTVIVPQHMPFALPMDIGEPDEEDKALDGVTIAPGPVAQEAYTVASDNGGNRVRLIKGRSRTGDIALLVAFGLAVIIGWLCIGPWVVSRLSGHSDVNSDEPTMQAGQSTTSSPASKSPSTDAPPNPPLDVPQKPESQFGKAPNADPSEPDHSQVPATRTEVPPAPARETPPPSTVGSDLGSGARMVVESTMGGGCVTVDGHSNPAWVTPHVFTLSPGSHFVTVSKAGFTEWSARISVEPGGEKFVMANLESEDGGIFTVETDPPGMEVFIDGKSYGRSRVDTTLRAGWHEYKVIPQPGMAAVTYRFQLKPGEILTKKIRMTIPSSSVQYPNRGASEDAASLSPNR